MKSLTRWTALAVGWLLGAAAPLLAAPAVLQPVTEIRDAKPIWQWASFVLMIGACIIVAFKNGKRSHQN